MPKTKIKWDILIAEDDPKDCQAIIKGLKTMANCTVAKDGEEALRIYRDWQKKDKSFDYIFLDVDIPKINGFDILKSIRSQEESTRPKKESRIIMVTTYKDSLMENYNLGWDDFITKPVDIKILILRLKGMVATSSA